MIGDGQCGDQETRSCREEAQRREDGGFHTPGTGVLGKGARL